MRSLGERDAAALAATTAELAVLDDAEPFPPHFLRRLAELMASRDAGYCELDRSRERTLFTAWWEDGGGGSEVPVEEGPEGEAYWRLRHLHPVCGYRERTNDWTNARAVSDFVTQRQFRCTRDLDGAVPGRRRQRVDRRRASIERTAHQGLHLHAQPTASSTSATG